MKPEVSKSRGSRGFALGAKTVSTAPIEPSMPSPPLLPPTPPSLPPPILLIPDHTVGTEKIQGIKLERILDGKLAHSFRKFDNIA